MMQHPNTLLGLGDGGAHRASFVMPVCPPRCYHIGDEIAPVERSLRLNGWSVARFDNAEYFGLHDRGRLTVGAKADINVVDFDALGVRLPRIVKDLPRVDVD